MRSEYPLLVIGAGPAGIGAALSAAQYGVEVALLDDQAGPGGQIYRNFENSRVPDDILGADYSRGASLLHALRQSGIDYFPHHSVWYLDREKRLGILHDSENRQWRAQCVIIASGAQERPMPFPGWEKPGVMTAGGAQSLMKSGAMVAEDGVVLAGKGPLLLLLAQQYLRAGVRIQALLDTTPAGGFWRALRHFPRALLATDYLLKGRRMISAIKQAEIPWYRVDDLRAEGDSRLESVVFHHSGVEKRLETNLLLVHDGVIPETHMAQAAGCELVWHTSQRCWRPQIDRWGESSQAGIFFAGDAAGIDGAIAAQFGGELCGLQVAQQLGFLADGERDRIALPLRRLRQRHLWIRPLLDAYYSHGQTGLPLDDETLVCRCEAVSAGELRQVIAMGSTGPNQAKAFTRCGMGACQGRFCAASVEQIFASELGKAGTAIGHYRARPPLKPITLGQLAKSGEIES